MTVAGVVAGSNNLIKVGDGRLILSGVNTYSGNTTISAGTLEVSGLLGSGNYSGNISNSGTFDYSSSSNQTISINLFVKIPEVSNVCSVALVILFPRTLATIVAKGIITIAIKDNFQF